MSTRDRPPTRRTSEANEEVMRANEERTTEMDKSVGDLMLKAGMRAVQYVVDTSECVFCNTTGPNGVHEEHCDFHGRTRDDLVGMLEVMAACGYEST